mmetsp:Transcript_763/g.1941  ORF Transcript_763/g.1941 Transcript_763/m.1941 type:complete len:222 (+) Transcript_763:2888-3553(+)
MRSSAAATSAPKARRSSSPPCAPARASVCCAASSVAWVTARPRLCDAVVTSCAMSTMSATWSSALDTGLAGPAARASSADVPPIASAAMPKPKSVAARAAPKLASTPEPLSRTASAATPSGSTPGPEPDSEAAAGGLGTVAVVVAVVAVPVKKDGREAGSVGAPPGGADAMLLLLRSGKLRLVGVAAGSAFGLRQAQCFACPMSGGVLADGNEDGQRRIWV